MLYLHSLLIPATVEHVREVFTDVLGTPTGRLAQLSAAAHVLDRAHRLGDYPDLQHPVHAHAMRLLEPTQKP